MRNFDYGRREGRMVRHKTHQMERHSRMLRSIVKDTDDLPDWINKKVILASDYLNSAAQYMGNRVSSGDYSVSHKTKKRHSKKRHTKKRHAKKTSSTRGKTGKRIRR